MCCQHGWNFVSFCLRSYCVSANTTKQHPQNWALLWTHLNKVSRCCEQNWTQFFGVEHGWTKFLGVVNIIEQSISVWTHFEQNENISVLWTNWTQIFGVVNTGEQKLSEDMFEKFIHRVNQITTRFFDYLDARCSPNCPPNLGNSSRAS